MVDKRSTTLRQRVTWALTGAVALFVALQSLLVYVVMAEREDDLVDEIVLTEARRLVHRMELGEAVPPLHGSIPLGPSMDAWYGKDHATPEGLPRVLEGLQPGMHELEPNDETWHVVVLDAPGGRLVVRYDATANEDRVYEFGAILFGMWLACSLIGYVLARTVAARVVRPMVEVASRISGWAPGAAVVRAPRDDEAGQLVEAFNRMQDRVDRSIAQEREFSANLSHEIRTPLTAIRTDAEIAGMVDGVPAVVQERLDRIATYVDEVAATIDAARAISSADPGPRAPVSIGQCLDDAWSGLRERAERAGLALVAEVPNDLIVELDRYGLLIVLRNLIRNAIDHAAPATLRIAVYKQGLSFADDGPGIAEADLPFVFERYYRARWKDRARRDEAQIEAGTRGLGLAIAKRVCDLHGWSLTVTAETEGTGHGTRFLLAFGERA